MPKWVEISYKDGWFPEGTKCILTNACANEQWAREKYAIFGLDSNPHVAFWPTTPIVLTKRELSKEEAYKAMRNQRRVP